MRCVNCRRELTNYETLIVDGVVKGPVCREGYQCYENEPVVIKLPAKGKMAMVYEHAERFIAV